MAFAAFAATPAVDPDTFLDDVKFLANKNMKGRGTGSPELEKCAAFIAAKFKSFGLQPIDGKSYYQAFDVTTNARLGDNNRFAYTGDGMHIKLSFPEDFIPFNFSAKAVMTGGVVFAGYGITAPEYNYDDYEGIDAHGKFVLIMRHEPQEFDEKSVFDGQGLHAARAVLEQGRQRQDAWRARRDADERRARRIRARPMSWRSLPSPPDRATPAFRSRRSRYEIADRWFAMAGKNLDEIRDGTSIRTCKPRSFAFPDALHVDANLDVERVVKTVHNVAGYLPGKTDEYVVIGAHYDHLGLGEQYSLAPSLAGTVHPGADDNASGTAGVIELARWFSEAAETEARHLVFDLRGRGIGAAGLELLREPSGAAAR